MRIRHNLTIDSSPKQNGRWKDPGAAENFQVFLSIPENERRIEKNERKQNKNVFGKGISAPAVFWVGVLNLTGVFGGVMGPYRTLLKTSVGYPPRK